MQCLSNQPKPSHVRQSRDDHWCWKSDESYLGRMGYTQQANRGLRDLRALHGHSSRRGLVRRQRGNPNGQLRDRRGGASKSSCLGDNAASVRVLCDPLGTSGHHGPGVGLRCAKERVSKSVAMSTYRHIWNFCR